VGEVIQDIEQGAGDIGYELGGQSPVMGAIGETLPTAAITALGLKPFRDVVKAGTGISKAERAVKKSIADRRANKVLQEAAPEADVLKREAGAIYNQLDESGAVIKSEVTDNLTADLQATMAKEGFHPKLNQPIAVALDEFKALQGTNVPIGKLDQLRKFAQAGAASMDLPTKRLGAIMLRKIDESMDKLKQSDFESGGGAIGEQYKQARNLWGRARRSEMITEAIKSAENAASGTENGIRVEIRKILRSDKKRKQFSTEEQAALREIADGTKSANIAKALGKLGFDFGKSTNTLGGLMGIGAGGAVAGAPGMIVVASIGNVSRELAKFLTRNNAKMADAIVRAGKDGVKIAREYVKRVPRKDQNPQHLAELFGNSEASLEALRKMPLTSLSKNQRSLVRDAVLYADMLQQTKNAQDSSR